MADERVSVSSEPKPPARSGHVAAAVGNLMLVWGGFNEVMSEPWLPQERYMRGSDVWIYHTLVDQWFCKRTSGEPPPGTSGASVVIVDHVLYLVGGHTYQGNTNAVFQLDLQSWEWSTLDMGTEDELKMSPRDKFVVWEYKNRIYVFGGFGIPTKGYLSEHGEFYADSSTFSPLRGWNNQLLMLNPSDGSWSNPHMKGSPPSPRAAHTAVRLQNKVFIFGGRHSKARLNDLHCLDLEEQTWSGELPVHGDMPKGRSWHSLTAVSDTHAVLYGGYTQDNSPLSDGWLLDSVTLQWTQLQLPEDQPRLWHTAVPTTEREVLVFGGSMNDILGSDQTEHTNGTILLQCTPRSLVRLCLDASYDHRALLQKEWTILPKHLYQILELRTVGYQAPTDSTTGHNTKTCVIS